MYDRIGYQPLATQNVAIGSSSTLSTGFRQTTNQVRLVASVDCYFAIGPAPVATTTSCFLPAYAIEYFQVRPGDLVAVIQSTGAGSLNVSEMGR